MHPVLQNILAVIIGIIVGSAINMGIVMGGSSLIPPPDGVNAADMESLKMNMHLFKPYHFITPWLAHALGTLAGAFVAARIAANRKFLFAMVIGAFFLLGGLVNVFLLPAPGWFVALDLVGAYLPMAWLGAHLAQKPLYS